MRRVLSIGSKSRRGHRRDGERLKSGRNSNKGAPSTSGPQGSIYTGKKDKRESVQQMNSSEQNMVSMPTANSTSEATPKVKISLPHPELSIKHVQTQIKFSR